MHVTVNCCCYFGRPGPEILPKCSQGIPRDDSPEKANVNCTVPLLSVTLSKGIPQVECDDDFITPPLPEGSGAYSKPRLGPLIEKSTPGCLYDLNSPLPGATPINQDVNSPPYGGAMLKPTILKKFLWNGVWSLVRGDTYWSGLSLVVCCNKMNKSCNTRWIPNRIK